MTTQPLKKVLVVDDFEGVATLVKEAIEDINYSVKTACSAEDGYRTYLRFKPDIVITDIEMGGKNGFELVDDIRCIDPEIKVIFMSGYSDKLENRRQSEVDRCSIAFLPKPFSLDDLYDHLDHFSAVACH
ncbi:MAG: response regulator [Deltaproteobacteria bacterium]|jgi:DNA-binding NtrC family response regulator|nr:response regulator [Deltaproteobacteria bacterium]